MDTEEVYVEEVGEENRKEEYRREEAEHEDEEDVSDDDDEEDVSIPLKVFKELLLALEDKIVGWFRGFQYVSNLVFRYVGVVSLYCINIFMWVRIWSEIAGLDPGELYQIVIMAVGSVVCCCLYWQLSLTAFGPIFLVATSVTLWRLGWKTFWKWRKMPPWERVLALMTIIAVTMGVLHAIMAKLLAERKINRKARKRRAREKAL